MKKYIILFSLYLLSGCSDVGNDSSQDELTSLPDDFQLVYDNISGVEFCNTISLVSDILNSGNSLSDSELESKLIHFKAIIQEFVNENNLTANSIDEKLLLTNSVFLSTYECTYDAQIDLRSTQEDALKYYYSWGLYGFGNAGENFPRDCEVETCCEKAICKYANCRDSAIWEIISGAGASAIQIIAIAVVVSYAVTTGNIGLMTQRIVSVFNAVLGTAEGFSELFLLCPDVWEEESSNCDCDGNSDTQDCYDYPIERICYPGWSTTDAWVFPC